MSMAGIIDHTLLRSDATLEDIRQLANEAKEYGFASVCVNPAWIAFAAEQLAGTGVKVCTVIGFPLGASTSRTKAYETEEAIRSGAAEVDMVIPIGALKSGDDDAVLRDIRAVVDAAAGKDLVKVIIETSLLTDEEKVRACRLAVQAGADFVKTSTGFQGGGASVEDVALMRRTVGPDIGVKASGGIRSLEDVHRMVKAGATRIGASSGVQIVKGEQGSSAY